MPFAITGSAAILYARADLLILSWLQGDAVAGRYGMAYRLWEAMGMIPASFLDALLPELSRVGERRAERGRLRALYRRAWLVVGGGAALMSVGTQLLAGPLMAALYGRSPDTAQAVGVLRVLLLAFPFTYLYLLNGHALYALARERRVTEAMVVVTVLKLSLDVWAVFRWSTTGAAGVALASEVLLYVWLQWLAWRSVLRGREQAKGAAPPAGGGGQGGEGAHAG
jgi:O-antigen/teichoic acid export membrane protein